MSSPSAISSHSTFGDYLKTLQGSEERCKPDEGANQVKNTPQPATVPDSFFQRPNPAQNLYYI